jgi:hypothetical protein
MLYGRRRSWEIFWTFHSLSHSQFDFADKRRVVIAKCGKRFSYPAFPPQLVLIFHILAPRKGIKLLREHVPPGK